MTRPPDPNADADADVPGGLHLGVTPWLDAGAGPVEGLVAQQRRLERLQRKCAATETVSLGE